MKTTTPLQERLHASAEIRHCFGCGADNTGGLRIKSFLEGNEGVCTWHPEAHHCSYPGYLNGGIACTLIDCHSAWTAFALECRERNLDMEAEARLPTGLTRAMHIEFLKPTPINADLQLRARLTKKGRTSRTVVCSIFAGAEECVRGEVTMVMSGT